ncbi:MAG: hypothetical protein ACRCXZ_04535 [Patescibacteria group bacterium]
MNRHKNKNALILWNFLNNSSEVKKSDIIWVLCSYNLEIADLSSQLYKDGFANKILFSGAYGKGKSHYYLEPESRVFAARAMELGVKKEDVYIDDMTTNTGESILLGYNYISKVKNKTADILLLHKPFKLRGTYNSVLAQYPDLDKAKIIPFTVEDDMEEYFEKFGEDKTINSMVKEVYKLINYPQKNWMVEENIPDSVLVAYNYLRNKGYDKDVKNLIKKEKPKPIKKTKKKKKIKLMKSSNLKKLPPMIL